MFYPRRWPGFFGGEKCDRGRTTSPTLKRSLCCCSYSFHPFTRRRKTPAISSPHSIVAYDPDNGDLGVAVQSKFFNAAAIVPWAKAGVGAIATQAFANYSYGPEGLKLLEQGLSASEVIKRLTEADAERDRRQLAVIDARGTVETFTGSKCTLWAGAIKGKYYSAQGNILVGQQVVEAMGKAFEETKGDLADRLVAALAAGQAAGGDARGKQSAGLLVVRAGFGRLDQSRFQSLGGGFLHVFSSTVINEVRVGYTRWTLKYRPEEQRSMVKELGIPGLTDLPRNTGWPLFSISGFAAIGDATNLPQGGPGVTYQFSEALHILRGKHTLKLGADLWKYRFGNFFLDASARGSFTFTGQFTGHPIADLLLGIPVQSFRGVGASDFTNFQQSYDFYFQDDWKVTPRLTLNLGLRYEYNTPYIEKKDRFTNFYINPPRLVLAGRDGVSRSTYDNDPNNLGPRFGFAYDVMGDGKMALRGGYGIYYDRTILNTILGMRLNPPHYEFNLFLSDPTVPRLTLEYPFPAGAGIPLLPSPSFFAKDFRDGYVQQWSLNVQRQVIGDLLVEIGYVGSKGTHLYRQRQLNQPKPAPGPVQPRRPFPQFGSINGIESSGHSTYHSLQLKADKRFSKNYGFLLAYTFAKSIDSNSAYAGNAHTTNNAQDGNNLRVEKGLSSFDMRHRFSLSYIIQLPFGQGQAYLSTITGIVGRLVSGWEITGITTLQSGTPSDPQLTIDRSNTGVFRDRPNRVGDPRQKKATPDQFWNPAAFVLQPPFSFGNAGRNVLPGPNWINFDLSILKNTQIREKINLQFRTEFFNLFNHPNFFNPERFVDTALFGKVTAAADPRLIQFGLKLIF